MFYIISLTCFGISLYYLYILDKPMVDLRSEMIYPLMTLFFYSFLMFMRDLLRGQSEESITDYYSSKSPSSQYFDSYYDKKPSKLSKLFAGFFGYDLEDDYRNKKKAHAPYVGGSTYSRNNKCYCPPSNNTCPPSKSTDDEIERYRKEYIKWYAKLLAEREEERKQNEMEYVMVGNTLKRTFIITQENDNEKAKQSSRTTGNRFSFKHIASSGKPKDGKK